MTETQTVFAIIDASRADMPLVQAAVANLARQSAAEPECLRYVAYLSVKEPTRLIIHEIWGSEEALQSHRKSIHVAQFKDSLIQTSAKVWASTFHALSP
jgi:quinol monooxygenase YgiN